MSLQAETMLDVDPLTAGLLAAIERQDITEDDLDGLRQKLYRQGRVDQERARQLFETHRTMPENSARWIDFFVEALADHFLTKSGNELVLADREEKQLLDALGDHAPIDDPGYRRLLLRLYLRASRVSERYQRLVLDMVHHHLMHDERRLLIDLAREPRTVDIVDLQLIRKLIFGAGGQYPCRVERAAMAFLLKIDQTTRSIIDPDAFHYLLEKALALHLAPDPEAQLHAPDQVDHDAAKWLIEQLDTGCTGPHATPLILGLTKDAEGLA